MEIVSQCLMTEQFFNNIKIYINTEMCESKHKSKKKAIHKDV